VTGAAGGIGSATVVRLLADGWAVVAVDSKGFDTVSNLPTEGAGLMKIVRDITEPDAANAIVGATLARFGGLHLLVNNAGIGNAKPVHETDDAELDRFISVNFSSAFRLAREAVKVMRPGASIVHVASVLSLVGTPKSSSYVATKAALAGLTRQMAAEYGPNGIRTNAVAPGLIETALTAERLKSDERFRRIWIDGTPWPRLGRADDVASAIRFLASNEAEFINGHVLVVDGGWSVATIA
jgi:NAD(P)-dependent dehydrogenase (short-subunit alcohol dehydrogenase family)